MAEVLVQFDEPQTASDGRKFAAQVRGRRIPGGLWEAWIEFLPLDGGDPIRTGSETEQLSRGDLRYWAAGLTRVYLDGALSRAISTSSLAGFRTTTAIPETNAEDASVASDEEVVPLARTAAVFDPVAVYRQSGEYVLRQELRALDAPALQSIIATFDIPDLDITDMARTYEDALAERIVAGVQQRVGTVQRAIRPGARPTVQ